MIAPSGRSTVFRTASKEVLRFSFVSFLVLAGCGDERVDTTYGRSRDQSINGTATLAELFRARGHAVRTAVRLSEELAEWADVIVRFAPYSGPPERIESEWYYRWLSEIGERKMIYVVRDYNALADYWHDVLERLPKTSPNDLRSRAESLQAEAQEQARGGGADPKERARPEEWFTMETARGGTTTCSTLEGPWSAGVDPARARIPKRESLHVDSEAVMLTGDGEALVMGWTLFNESLVLAVANGSFLVNGGLLNRERRPLAIRTVDWIGAEPLNVAFVEGRSLLGGAPPAPSGFELLRIWPFGWVVAQLLFLGLVACLARAPRLGRPRPEPPPDENRPVAHPEAIGLLLARAGQAADARAILEAYRGWRNLSNLTRGGKRLDARPASVADQPTEKLQSSEPLEHE